MEKRILSCCLISFLIVLGVYATAPASNLVVNPDFESWNGSGMPLGWNVTAGRPSDVKVPGCNSAGVDGFGFSVNLGTSYTDFDQLSQTIATLPGTTYTFSFWAYVLVDPNQAPPQGELSSNYSPELKIYWNGGLISDLNVTGDWWRYSFEKTATGTDTVISFAGKNGLASTRVDNVFVGASSQTVPVPATLLLLGSGLVGLIGLKQKYLA